MEIHIALGAEKIFTLFNLIPVTNSILMVWIVMLFLLIFSLAATRKVTLVPGNLQSIAEMMVEGLYNIFHTINGENLKLFFPLLATIFIYIIAMNWSGLLPGVGTVGIYENENVPHEQITTASAQNILPEVAAKADTAAKTEGTHGKTSEINKETTVAAAAKMENNALTQAPEDKVHQKFIPLFRSGTADLNTTLGLALVAVLAIQYFGIKSLGLGHFKKYLNFSSPIFFFVGILEAIGEVSRVISFAFRLFGNIFAGEVLLTIIAFLMPLIAPIPFLGLELFVGFIQALVFSMLTSVFLSTAMAKH